MIQVSDSDDELLGVNIEENDMWINGVNGVNGVNGWNDQKRDFPTGKWKHESKKSTLVSMPTMEIINMRTEPKQNRYQRMREVHNVVGFIVNVHDAVNFDIDLDIPPQLHERYSDVVSNQYTYQDLSNDFLENPDLNKTIQITPKIGTTYRCRLRGVGMNQLPHYLHTNKSNKMCIEVKRLIDRTDGWITCTLSDIDVYKRLLVDITIHTSSGPVNLRNHLLSLMEEEDDPIFYPYSGRRSS